MEQYKVILVDDEVEVIDAVSYTHLDVYKRQLLLLPPGQQSWCPPSYKTAGKYFRASMVWQTL